MSPLRNPQKGSFRAARSMTIRLGSSPEVASPSVSNQEDGDLVEVVPETLLDKEAMLPEERRRSRSEMRASSVQYKPDDKQKHDHKVEKTLLRAKGSASARLSKWSASKPKETAKNTFDLTPSSDENPSNVQMKREPQKKALKAGTKGTERKAGVQKRSSTFKPLPMKTPVAMGEAQQKPRRSLPTPKHTSPAPKSASRKPKIISFTERGPVNQGVVVDPLQNLMEQMMSDPPPAALPAPSPVKTVFRRGDTTSENPAESNVEPGMGIIPHVDNDDALVHTPSPAEHTAKPISGPPNEAKVNKKATSGQSVRKRAAANESQPRKKPRLDSSLRRDVASAGAAENSLIQHKEDEQRPSQTSMLTSEGIPLPRGPIPILQQSYQTLVKPTSVCEQRKLSPTQRKLATQQSELFVASGSSKRRQNEGKPTTKLAEKFDVQADREQLPISESANVTTSDAPLQVRTTPPTFTTPKHATKAQDSQSPRRVKHPRQLANVMGISSIVRILDIGPTPLQNPFTDPANATNHVETPFLQKLRNSTILDDRESKNCNIKTRFEPNDVHQVRNQSLRPSLVPTVSSASSESETDTHPAKGSAPIDAKGWTKTLPPQYQSILDALCDISHRIIDRFMDSETAIDRVIEGFVNKGKEVIARTEADHRHQCRRALENVDVVKDGMSGRLSGVSQRLTQWRNQLRQDDLREQWEERRLGLLGVVEGLEHLIGT